MHGILAIAFCGSWEHQDAISFAYCRDIVVALGTFTIIAVTIVACVIIKLPSWPARSLWLLFVTCRILAFTIVTQRIVAIAFADQGIIVVLLHSAESLHLLFTTCGIFAITFATCGTIAVAFTTLAIMAMACVTCRIIAVAFATFNHCDCFPALWRHCGCFCNSHDYCSCHHGLWKHNSHFCNMQDHHDRFHKLWHPCDCCHNLQDHHNHFSFVNHRIVAITFCNLQYHRNCFRASRHWMWSLSHILWAELGGSIKQSLSNEACCSGNLPGGQRWEWKWPLLMATIIVMYGQSGHTNQRRSRRQINWNIMSFSIAN